jgi:PGF-pre-PGF domain-containing protein
MRGKNFVSKIVVFTLILMVIISFSMVAVAVTRAGFPSSSEETSQPTKMNEDTSTSTTSDENTDKTVSKVDSSSDDTTHTTSDTKLTDENILDPGITNETNTTIKSSDTSKIASLETYTDNSTQYTLVIEKELGDVNYGQVIEVTTEKTRDVTIDKVSFTPTANLTRVTLSVSKLSDKPIDVEKSPIIPNETIYEYLDIKLLSDSGYVEEDKIESMKFEFKVKKQWIEEKHIDKNTVTLKRYRDSRWHNLSTMLLRENESYIFYEAVTPGLSIFVVVGSEIVEDTGGYITEPQEIPWVIGLGIISTSTSILAIVLFKARYIYFDEDKEKELKTRSKPGKKV